MRGKLLNLIVLLSLVALLKVANSQATFCWRNSTTRGAGQPLANCTAGQEKIGLLCYDKCPSGFIRFGFDCHQTCPNSDDWREDGLFCRRYEYGRGGGYPWQFGDPIFRSDGQWARCTRDNPVLGCQASGAIVYPKCKSGYSAFGCCICRPQVPNCPALGYNPGVDLSCAKKIIIGNPLLPGCPSGTEVSGLLCYPPCPKNYKGVGPVCWGLPPIGWVECGMGAAKDNTTCATNTFSQVTSVISLAVNIITLGTSSAASVAVNDATQTSILLAKVQPLITRMQDIWKKTESARNFVSKVGDLAGKGATAYAIGSTLIGDTSKMTAADIVKFGAQVASLFDPTGIASVVAAYSNPLCSDIK